MLVQNHFAPFEDSADNEVPTATLAIYDGIAGALARKEDNYIDRASAATMCVRRRWYQGHGTKGKPLTPRKLVNFFLGDLGEAVMGHYIRDALVGEGKLYSEVDFGKPIGEITLNGKRIVAHEQPTYHWTINDEITVTAHLDGLGKRNLDGKWEIIEVKTAAEYGFDEFRENGPGDYLKQAHACMLTEELRALDVKDVHYFYVLKSTGHLWDRVHSFDPTLAEQVRQDFIAARGATIPDRPFGYIPETFRKKPTGRMILGFPCTYCPYIETCFPNAKLEWKAGQSFQKPVYVKGD